jgi:GT2 family glycosyltransferase
MKDVDECLDSIIIQTRLPKEVIIVDDSDSDKIENLIERRENEFKEKEIHLIYIKNKKEKSLTMARNIGVEIAMGDIILFLDDDVILDKNYIKEILNVYEKNPNALGVQGFIEGLKTGNIFIFMFNKLFYLGFNEKNRCRVLPSFNNTYAFFVDKIIECEWLSGANQSYKKEIFEEFKYDDNLKRYSFGEDLDISYRIFKKYSSSLFMTSYAKLIHKTSQEGKLPKRELVNMREIYGLYLFHKNIDQTLKNKLIFLWSRIGYLIINFGSIVIKSHRLERILQLKYLIEAYILCMKHIKEIKKGDLEFFNIGLEK